MSPMLSLLITAWTAVAAGFGYAAHRAVVRAVD